MTSPYRKGETERETVVVTRSLPIAPAWVAWLGAAVAAFALLLFVVRSKGGDAVKLDCRDGDCVVTQPRGGTTHLAHGVPYVIVLGSAQKLGTPIEGTYFVSLLGAGVSADIGLRSRANAEAFQASLRDVMKRGAETHESYVVGGAPGKETLLPLAGGGLLLLALSALARGSYRFVVSPQELTVAKAGGLVPAASTRVPVARIAEIVAVSQKPDAAFARYTVVVREHDGSVTPAIPVTLTRADAFALANEVNDALAAQRARVVVAG